LSQDSEIAMNDSEAFAKLQNENEEVAQSLVGKAALVDAEERRPILANEQKSLSPPPKERVRKAVKRRREFEATSNPNDQEQKTYYSPEALGVPKERKSVKRRRDTQPEATPSRSSACFAPSVQVCIDDTSMDPPNALAPSVLCYMPPSRQTAEMNERILDWVRDEVIPDPAYRIGRNLHGNLQADAISYGAPFGYGRDHHWEARPIPPQLLPLKDIAELHTRLQFNVALLKVYRTGNQSLARHQDVDGSNMNVACFTFVSDPHAVRVIEWYKTKTSARVHRSMAPTGGGLPVASIPAIGIVCVPRSIPKHRVSE